MNRNMANFRPFPVIDLVRAAAPRREPLTWPPRHALEDSLPVVAAAPAALAGAIYVPRDSKLRSRVLARQDMT
ncbi:hypothetical protein OV090_24240 [Nannocystis sp. RBIL2]|uniref:hypothetical protein n=1 Tax=Nannocystis sp. RBIL2 TaxID=2996788 RepID=UPI00227126FD|nr:hypothetical protein [Nannocystis sp. RBIL2]MCY1067873.1 hypothetical protein [Nannocystis sp. RBIL2]